MGLHARILLFALIFQGKQFKAQRDFNMVQEVTAKAFQKHFVINMEHHTAHLARSGLEAHLFPNDRKAHHLV